MILNINEPISNESFNKLVNTINTLREYEQVTIYLNSEGGDVESMESMIDLINQHHEKIDLIATGKIYSAAFILFFRTACRKRILNGTMGMAHYIRCGIQINEEKQPYYEHDKAISDWMEVQNQWTLAFYKALKFTRAELNIIKASKEAYFSTARLNELLNAGFN